VTIGAEMVDLDERGESRAARLHDESLIFIGHDHNILAPDIEIMTTGGVTAKQLHLSVDCQIFGPREQFLRSAPRVSIERELREHERQGSTIPDVAERLDRAAAESSSEGFLRRALVAMDYVHWSSILPKDVSALRLSPKTSLQRSRTAPLRSYLAPREPG